MLNTYKFASSFMGLFYSFRDVFTIQLIVTIQEFQYLALCILSCLSNSVDGSTILFVSKYTPRIFRCQVWSMMSGFCFVFGFGFFFGGGGLLSLWGGVCMYVCVFNKTTHHWPPFLTLCFSFGTLTWLQFN